MPRLVHDKDHDSNRGDRDSGNAPLENASDLILVFFFCSRYSMHILSTCVEPIHEISNNVVSATSKGSDQSAHMRSLIRAFASHLNIVRI